LKKHLTNVKKVV